MNPMTRWRWLAWPPLLYLIVMVVIPTFLIARYSFLERDVLGGVRSVFSGEGWTHATDAYTLPILGRSLYLALGVTAACLLVGYPCAMSLARIDQRWRNVLIVLMCFPLITSLLLRIYGWMNLLPLEWRGTVWAFGLVMTVNYLPFLVLPLLRAWERADANLALAAMDLGATPWQTFWHVSWPITRSGMWAGCALVFIPACGDYLVPQLLGAGRVPVLGTLIGHEFLTGRNWPYAAAASIWLLAIVTLPVIFALFRRDASAVPSEPAAQARDIN